MENAEWWSETHTGLQLRVVVQPKASRSEVVGTHGEPPRLKIRLAAPPVDGAANEELVLFLSKTLGVAKSLVSIVRGHHSRKKDLHIEGLSITKAKSRLRLSDAN